MRIRFLKFPLSLLVLITILFACSEDNDANPEPDDTLAEQRAETLLKLSGGNEQVWWITSAILTNESGTFDLSTNFNILDDEFLFDSNKNLTWSPGNDINVNGTSAQQTLLDFYRSPIRSTIDFLENSSTDFATPDGRISLSLVNETTLSGTISYEGRSINGGQLEITLTQKGPDDYAQAPNQILEFSEINTFNSVMVVQGSIGMTGSYADNSLMIITREDSEAVNNMYPEKIFKLNIGSNTFDENLFFQSDLVTKRPHIINNEIVVVGGRYVNIYGIDATGDPLSTAHNANNGNGLTRFGSAVRDNEIYITGGDVDNGTGTATPNKIRKYDASTGTLIDIATLPQPRYWADTEIINDDLYVFGGRLEFVSDDYQTESYKVNLTTGEITTFELPVGLFASYAVRYQNLIYVGGQIREDIDGDGTYDDLNIFMGVYDTITGEMTEIETNLDDSDQYSTISGMTIFNGKLYVIYGDGSQPIDPIPVWSIMAASIE